MAETIRLTTGQALVKFLNNQFISVDGKEAHFVEGIFNIFGHGNVLGIGQALEQDAGHLKVIQGKKTNKEWHMQPSPIQNKCLERKFMLLPLLLVRELLT